MRDAPDLAGVAPSQVEQTLRERYQKLQNLAGHKAQAIKFTQEAEQRCAAVSQQLERIISSLDPRVLDRLSKEQRRREEIYRHVSQHLRDVEELCEQRAAEVAKAGEALGIAVAHERDLQEKVASLADKVGWGDVTDLDGIELRLTEMKEEEELKDMECMF